MASAAGSQITEDAGSCCSYKSRRPVTIIVAVFGVHVLLSVDLLARFHVWARRALLAQSRSLRYLPGAMMIVFQLEVLEVQLCVIGITLVAFIGAVCYDSCMCCFMRRHVGRNYHWD